MHPMHHTEASLVVKAHHENMKRMAHSASEVENTLVRAAPSRRNRIPRLVRLLAILLFP